MTKPTYYITTPIYYPNDKLHIGHAYSTTVADTLARYKRLKGCDVRFLTGTDEHGQKLQRKAEAVGKTPQEYIDGIVEGIKKLWERLDISYDDFIRTTESRHTEVVQKIFSRLLEQGDIYLDNYEGWYCTPDESFWTERQLKDGKCPECGGDVEWVTEQSYFFKMGKYADRLIQYFHEHPDFLVPESRKHEMLNNFLLPGLEDLCVSRTTFDWGIPVRENPKHVIYVWLDALTNYITALGYLSEEQDLEERFRHYWPADVHLMSKEIVRFHSIYWPIILMALDLPLPKQVVGHGWLLMKDGKMSKSKGNVIDPNQLIDRYGADALRYFLLREISFGQDGVFTFESFMDRLNFDLANDLGNLLHRSLAMVNKFAGGIIPGPARLTELEDELKSLVLSAVDQTEESLEKKEFSKALDAIWQLVRRGNRYIDETAPWALHKAGDGERLNTVLYTMFEVLRIVSVLIQPFMPKTSPEMWKQMGLVEGEATTWDSARQFGQLPEGLKTSPGDPIFPRLDVEKELAALGVLAPAAAEQKSVKSAPKTEQASQPKEEGAGLVTLIDIEDFSKVELRVAQVVSAEKIEKADKLLKLQLDLGTETRQVVSGIAKHYQPEQLVGQKVILVANLKPVKLRGVESHGMILAASTGDQLVLATVSGDIPVGAKVK